MQIWKVNTGREIITFTHSRVQFLHSAGRGNRNQHDKYYNHPQNTDFHLCNACTHTHTHPSDLEVLSIEGQRAADQCVEDHSEAPDIHLRSVVLLALEELWSCVGRGATERVQLVPQSKFITEAKVGYFDVHVCVQQQVLCLQTNGEERGQKKGHLLCSKYRSANKEEERNHAIPNVPKNEKQLRSALWAHQIRGTKSINLSC